MFYQILTTKRDSNGNPRKILLIYGIDGNVTKAYKYSYSSLGRELGYTELPSFGITVSEYNHCCEEYNAVEMP